MIMRHPVNLLFMKWVTEWRDEANQKKQQSALSYNRALKSLQKYPLALTSGKETKLLQNVGEKTAKMLDERLNEWKREFGEPTLELVDPDLPLNKMSKKKSPKKSEDDGNLNKSPLKLPPGSYVPAYRSGSYALLLTLYKNQIDTLGTSFLSKVDLQIKAQALCDKSFTVPEKNCYYTAWSSMATLIEKNLVEKKKSPAQYSLTPAGFELAVSLENIRETTNVAVDINDLSPIKTSPAKKRKSEDKEKAAVSKASEVPTKVILIRFKSQTYFEIINCFF